MIGNTLDNIYDLKIRAKLKALPKNSERVFRIVVDNPFTVINLSPIVEMVKEYATPMIQIQDSFGEVNLSDRAFLNKAETLFSLFRDQCTFWEIGNEVNGNWCSENIAERVKKVLELVPEGHKTALTLFWEPNLMSWYKANPIQTDYVFISFYPDGLELFRHWEWEEKVNFISSLNPKAFIGIGEFGFEEWKGNLSWRLKETLRKELESLKVDHPRWIGGGFYWDGQKEGWR